MPKRTLIRVMPVQEFITFVPEKEMSKVPGKKVTSLSEYADIIDKMHKAIDNGGFSGPYKGGYAIAHQQVERDHARFFVVNDNIAKMLFEGHSVISNPEILDAHDEVETREGCLSYPYRGDRKRKRFMDIAVRFDDADGNEVKLVLNGIAAQVFQHEYFHTMGETIWGDKY